jgi:hypothetical protein
MKQVLRLAPDVNPLDLDEWKLVMLAGAGRLGGKSSNGKNN